MHEGYAFAPTSELTAKKINGNDAAVINNIPSTLTLSYTFPPTRTVTGVAIATQPKLSYTHGETLDLSALAVRFTYNDASTENIAFSNFASHGITASPASGAVLSRSTHNGESVTVTYGSFAPLTTNNLTVSPKVTTLTVNTITEQVYTGSAVTPTVTVRDGSTTLTLTDDYIVSYSNNVNAGTATVTISGAGNYAGSTGNATFTINRASITSAAITVTAPVKSAVPSTTARGTGNFTTGAVSWNPSHSLFQGGTVYTATVTLTANANYAFAALTGANAAINGNNALVPNNTGNTVTLSYTFTATDLKTVTGIAIKTQPTKLTYTHGETLNLSGLEVTLSHDDGTTEDVALSAFGSKNISATPANGAVLSRSTNNGSPVTVTHGSLTANTSNLTVDKANPTVTWPTGLTANYGQTLSNISLASYTNGGTGSFSWTTPSTSVGNVGTQSHSMTFTPTDTANYNTLTQNVSITVGKINPTVTWLSGLTATYGQTLSAVSLPGNSTGTGTFTWTTPTSSVGNAGTQSHSMTFSPTDTANYSTVTQNVNITVNKADPIVTWPTGLAATYGQTLANISLASHTNTGGTAGSFSWTTPTASVGNAGTQSHNMTFTPTSTANYNTATQNVNITVNKATPAALTWPSASAITYPATLSTSSLTGGSTTGTWAWQTGSTIPTVANSGYNVVFTPTDTANYDWTGVTTTQAVAVTVNPAIIASAALTVTAPANGGTPAATASGTGNFIVSMVSWSPSVTTFTIGVPYTVTITLTANANYTFTGGLTTATINTNTATVTRNGTTATLSHQFDALSADPTEWTAVSNSTFGASDIIFGIAYGDGKFVAVGTYGKMAYSTDGINWSPVTNGTFGEDSIRGIAYGNGKFVAVGFTGKMAYSTDGISWIDVSNSTFGADTGGGSDIYGITYGDGKFVAVGNLGKMAYSTDGANWTAVMNSTFDNYYIYGIAYGDGKFVAVGNNSKIAHSADGVTWTAGYGIFGTSTSITAYDIVYGNGKFVAVGDDSRIAYSTNGESWTAVSNNMFNYDEIRGIAYGSGNFVAVGRGARMAYSADGESWTAVSNSAFSGAIYSIAYGDGKFVAGGGNGRIAVCTP